MDRAPTASLLLAASGGLTSILVAVLVVLGVLAVAAIVVVLVLITRRRSPNVSSATMESTAPPPPSAPPPPAPSSEPAYAMGAGAFAPRPPTGPFSSAPTPTSAEDESGVAPPDPAPETDDARQGEEAGAGDLAAPDTETAEPEVAATAPEESEQGEARETQDGTTEGSAVEKGGEAPDEVPVAASPTQTPADVDERTPSELAAAAQEAEAAEEAGAAAEAGETVAPQPARQEVAIGPPRPLSLVPAAAPDPARLRLLGLTLGMLTERMRRESPPQLGTALARLVDSDQEAARAQLTTLALSLLGEDQEPSGGDGQLSLFLEEALEGEVERGFSFSSMPEFQQALGAVAPELRTKLETIVWAGKAGSVGILTTDDVETLERVAVAMATALILDTAYDVRRAPGQDA